ncbi:MAG: peroxiredoxin [Gammaproteobacteria bacterium]|nr:peroxiredoxin [Gammaproteobacteria bacterium]
MQIVTRILRALSIALLIGGSSMAAAELAVGDAAPAFNLADQNNQMHALADYQGKWVVVYFYPKDETPGCTEEACRFRDDIAVVRSLGGVVLGISLDSVESHAAFAEHHKLPFTLLSDADGAVAQAYGSKAEFRGMTIAARHTFIVDPHGNIAKIYREVTPSDHSAEVIEDIRALAANMH